MSLALITGDRDAARVYVRGVIGALGPGGRPLDPVQHDILQGIARELWGLDVAIDGEPGMPAAELAARVPDPEVRRRLVELMVTLELLLHPLPPAVSRQVDAYATALGVRQPMVRSARLLAREQATLMYLCIQRNSWYPAETRRMVARGRLWEVVRSKLAYYGVAEDPGIAARWRGLGGCPPGSWGRGVHDFYVANGFPFPGEPHGIYEVGARHDWVHVLTDYGTSPEGEIDVFAFIAAAMPDPAGFVLLVVTLGVFQSDTIRHMFGRPIPHHGAGALSAEGAPGRFVEALRRGAACTTDVLGLDHFAWADRDLAEVRRELNVLPRGAPAPAGAAGRPAAP